jgi:hypothetical protein
MHVISNILQDGDVTGNSQVTKPDQLLTPFTILQIENTLDTQNGEVVIQLLDHIWHSFHFLSNSVEHFLHLRTFAREGQTLCLNLVKR